MKMHHVSLKTLFHIHIIFLASILFKNVEGSLPTIVCGPKGYEPCDLSRLSLQNYDVTRLYVSEVHDVNGQRCNGLAVQLDNWLYKPNTLSSAAYLCLSNDASPIEVALIYFSGFVKDSVDAKISYGMPWSVKASLMLSHNVDRLNIRHYYGKIAIKLHDCDTSFGMLANMTNSKRIGVEGYWSSEYSSTASLTMMTSDLVLCVCHYRRACLDVKDYNEFLTRPDIDGPLLSRFINYTCYYGAKCSIFVPGMFRNLSRTMALINPSKKGDSGKLLVYTNRYYEYIMDENEVPSGGTATLQLFWYPNSFTRNATKVNIGAVTLHNDNIGDLFVVPFGRQELRLVLNTLIMNSRFYIFEQERAFGSTMGWNMVYEPHLVSSKLVIEYEFNPDNKYSLRYMSECSSGITCADTPTTDNTGLLGSLIPQGVRKYSHATCTYPGTCFVSLETVNMEKFMLDRRPIIMARSCNSGPAVMPLMTKNGTSVDVNPKSHKYTIFKWIQSSDGYSLSPGERVKLCWCGSLSIDGPECRLKDYSIDVGEVEVYQNSLDHVICYIGSTCSVIIDSTYKENVFYFLSPGSTISNDLVIDPESNIFPRMNIERKGNAFMQLASFIEPSYEYVGEHYLYSRTVNPVTKNETTTIMKYAFDIKRIELEKRKYYLKILDRGALLLKRNFNLIHQFLIIEPSCGTPGYISNIYPYSDNGIQIRSSLQHSVLKVCWCKAFGTNQCKTREDFKLELGEIYRSGAHFVNGLVCSSNSYCRLNMEFMSFFDLAYGLDGFLTKGTKLVVKTKCDDITASPLSTLLPQDVTKPSVLGEVDGTFTLRMHVMFWGLMGNISPGMYSLCIIDTEHSMSAKVSDLAIRGVFDAGMDIMIHLGRPFNVTVVGYNLEKEITGFLSVDSTCKRKLVDNRFMITMTDTPTLRYDNYGVDMLVWYDVLILRDPSVMSSEANACNSTMDYPLHMCIASTTTHFVSGLKYRIYQPPLIRISANKFDGPNGFKFLPLRTRNSIGNMSLLVVTVLKNNSPLINCESNKWAEDLSGVTLQRYLFYPSYKMPSFPNLLNASNIFVCWCIGDGCATLNDFRVSVILPHEIDSVTFNVVSIEASQLKVSVPGLYTSTFDELRVVEPKIKCGFKGASKTPNYMFHKKKSITVSSAFRTGASSEAIEYTYANIIGRGTVTRNDKGFEWHSRNLPLRDIFVKTHFMFRMCYCSSLSHKGCRHDEDFSDWVGSVVSENAHANPILLRITTFPSAMIDGFAPCRSTYRVSASTSIIYKLKNNFLTVYQLVSGFKSRNRSSHEAFLLEACYSYYKEGDSHAREYEHVMSSIYRGYFRMQNLYVLTNVHQDVVLYGVDIPADLIEELIVIPPNDSCDTWVKERIITHSVIKLRIHQHAIAFRGLLVDKPGIYKFCLRLNDTGNNSFGKVPSFLEGADESFDALASSIHGPGMVSNFSSFMQATNADSPDRSKRPFPVYGMIADSVEGPEEVSFVEQPQKNNWKVGGLIVSSPYRVVCIADLMLFRNIRYKELELKKLLLKKNSCRMPGYRNYVMLCSLIKSELIIVSDCNNVLWAVKVPDTTDILGSKDPSWRVNLLPTSRDTDNWKSCKEYPLQSVVVFLGMEYVVVVKAPMVIGRLQVVASFKHGLTKPLDIALFVNSIIISDGYTHTMTSYTFAKGIEQRQYDIGVLRRNCYHNALYVMGDGGSSYDLFALDAMNNSLVQYKLTDGASLRADVSLRYTGVSPSGIDAGPLDRPCCIDGYFQDSLQGKVKILLVGENVSGRILVFKVDDLNIGIYKVIHTEGIHTYLAVDSNNRSMLLSSWRLYQGQMSNCIYFRTIDSYVSLGFSYNVMGSYQIGSSIELVPVVTGDPFEFFMEDLGSNQGVSVLNVAGLILDGSTGVISGRLVSTGSFEIKIIGGNMLKQIIHSFVLVALCPPSHQFNVDTRKCEQCPVGTYRNDEPEDICIPCQLQRPNTTTQMAGARSVSDCLCDRGFYMKEDECVPCQRGSFKFEVGNSECTGTCGANMTTLLTIDEGVETFHCVCMPKFFDLKIALALWDTLPVAILSLTGLTFSNDGSRKPTNLDSLLKSEDVCIPCAVGYYCPGNKTLPQPCGIDRTTRDRLSEKESDCVCDIGYGFDAEKGCMPCSGFGYKDTIGNISCVPCGKPTTKQSPVQTLATVPSLGPISIVDYEQWNKELREHYARDHDVYSQILDLLHTARVFAISERATSADQCLFCISGTYMDRNMKECTACPSGNFCPGGDSIPVSCGPNAVTRGPAAASPFDCFCSRGYGNIYEGRHPIRGMIVCQHCPLGYFQHMEYFDGPCIPCPANSSTSMLGATGLMDCLPDPGYYLDIRREHGQTQPVTIFAHEIHVNYESFVSEKRQVSVNCLKTHVDSILCERTLILIRPSFDTCSSACNENIYCKGFSFDDTVRLYDSDYDPSKANEVLSFNGLRYIKHSLGVCTLYLFEVAFSVLSEEDLKKTSGKLVTTICVATVTSPDIVFSMRLCPIGYYCDNTTAYVKCPPNSTTLGVGAISVSDCLCLSGYEPSSNQRGVCVPCPLGSYKQEIGNNTCKRCPDRFRTFDIGSKSITDCACTPGHYAILTNDGTTTLPHTSVYKRMKDSNLFKSSDEEVSKFDKEFVVGSYSSDSLNFHGSNPYKVYLNVDNKDEHMEIDSFIYISKEALLLPKSTPTLLLKKLSNFHTITCERCKPHHYCPGGWFPDSKKRIIHNIPYRCPYGSSVPNESTNATSIAHCLCMPGYRLNLGSFNKADNSSGGRPSTDTNNLKDDSIKASKFDPSNQENISPYLSSQSQSGQNSTDATASLSLDSDSVRRDKRHQAFVGYGGVIPQCVKCDAGMYKEGQENSLCSGRCMQYATTFGGATSKRQCFCNYGRYMMFEESLGSVQLTCARCMRGAICPGGLHSSVVDKLRKDGNFVNILLQHHSKPIPRFGFFAAFKEQGVDLWTPSSQPMLPLTSVSTDMLDFHDCPLEYTCASNDGSPCSAGSNGYLCLKCNDGYDRSYFRSSCIVCGNILVELVRYLHGRMFIWIFGVIIIVLLRRKQFYQFVILKIWLDFCFSMMPYGMIPINSPSSLRRFSVYYNRFLGFQQRLFKYIRLRCIFDIFSIKVDGTTVWYAQRLLVALQPLVDSLLLYCLLGMMWYIYSTMMVVHDRYLRHSTSVPRGPQAPVSLSPRAPVERSRSLKSTPSEASCSKIRRRKRWITLWDCVHSLYYLNFQFICQELLQALWCVDVKYKSEAPIRVLLYMPTQVCRFDDRLYLSGVILTSLSLTILVGYYITTLILIVRRRRGHRIYTSGRQQHTLAWDAALFLRRFLVAMIMIFQASTSSTGSAEKLRMLSSILVTSLLLIGHMSILPYQVRDDNVFNRLELFSLILNNITAFLLLGSFSYDFNYNSLIPLMGCLFYTLLLLWYIFVECGFICELRPRLRRLAGLSRGFWLFCRQLLVWHCHSQITFDYSSAEMVIEKPFSGHASPCSKVGERNRRARVSMAGRRALCLCLEQSVSRYVLEQKRFRIPLYWAEFMLRYSFGYKYGNVNVRRGTVLNDEIHVDDMFSPDLFNLGPINTWQLSMATLTIPLHSFVALYQEFEGQKLSSLWKLKYLYSELCFRATESLSGRNIDVPHLLERVHLLHHLKKRVMYLEKEFNIRLAHAHDGERATRDVQELGDGVDSIVSTPLTNEEILTLIADVEYRNLLKNNIQC